MGTSLGGVLAVDKGVVVVVVLSRNMSKSSLEIAILDMYDRIERISLQVILQQVEETVLSLWPTRFREA